jgi:hypothetical protein
MFLSVVTLLRTSVAPIRPNRLRRNPLEHAFGKVRIRCRDVNSMRKMLSAMATEIIRAFAKFFFEILGSLPRVASVGVDWEPWSESGASALTIDPRSIADSLLLHYRRDLQDGIDPTVIDELLHIPKFTRFASDTNPSAIATGEQGLCRRIRFSSVDISHAGHVA